MSDWLSISRKRGERTLSADEQNFNETAAVFIRYTPAFVEMPDCPFVHFVSNIIEQTGFVQDIALDTMG